MAATPFTSLSPTRTLHVTVGTGTGDGSSAKPFHSIQQAVNAATPGTAIIVHAGTYTESIKIPWSKGGTSSAPIWLVSGDGPQAAKIVGASSTLPVIQALGVDNYIIKNFSLSGGYDGIQFSQSGRDFTNMVSNIVIQGNSINNVAHDGIKVGQADNVHILDNRINGVASEEGIDFVAVTNAVIARNEISNVHGTTAAIFAKGGSTNVVITDNYIHNVTGDGIAAGGNTDAASFKPGFKGYEGKNIDVVGNKIDDVGKRPVSVRGATDIDVSSNYLDASAKYGNAVYVTTGGTSAGPISYSSNVRVNNNIIDHTTALLKIDAGNNNSVTQSNNKTGTFTDVVGPTTSNIPLWGSTTTSKLGAAATAIVADTSTTAASTSTPAATTAPATQTDTTGSKPAAVDVTANHLLLGDTVHDAVVTSALATMLVGNGLDNNLTGGAGDDVFLGGKGNDHLTGGDGSDMFIVRAQDGSDVITDFQPNDHINLAGSEFSTFEQLMASMKQVGANAVLALGDGNTLTLENVTVSSLTPGQFMYDHLTVPTASADWTNVVSGGTKGFDWLTGTAGNDLLDGKGGADVMAGGDGDDTYVVDNKADIIIEHSNGGVDTALVSASSFAMTAGLENVTVKSTTGSEIEGNPGANIIIGGAGADHISGGGGNDLLTGGAGNDIFVFKGAGADTADKITDFTSGQDKLDFHALHAEAPGGTISTNEGSAGLEVYFDHDGHHDLVVTLAGVPTLASNDYLF